MGSNGIEGVMVPILTPLTPDERVDRASLRRLVGYLIDNGVHGIWAAGTTGEFAALPDSERLIAIETVVDEVAGRVPVIGNISAAGTALAIELGLSLQEAGLDAMAATPPYYYPCAQDELQDHFRYIKDRVGAALWVYNIPPTVKTTVEPATIAGLAGEGTVAGVKDSSGAGELLAQLNVLCDHAGIELRRFLGSEFRIATTRGVGAHGVIPAIGNLIPAVASKAWEAGEAGDATTVRELQGKIMVASGVMQLARGGGPNAARLAGMKSALKIMGVIDHDVMTRPLRPLNDEEQRGIPPILDELGLAS